MPRVDSARGAGRARAGRSPARPANRRACGAREESGGHAVDSRAGASRRPISSGFTRARRASIAVAKNQRNITIAWRLSRVNASRRI